MRLAAASFALLLAGCAAPGLSPELERRHALYGPYCERLGKLEGTFGYADCVMWQEMVDQEQQKARAAAR